VLDVVHKLGLKRCIDESIEIQNCIGEGESFVVQQCLYEKRLVAVKHIKLGDLTPQSHGFKMRLRTVLNEIQIMQHTPLREHPNILSVLGYGWKTSGRNTLPYLMVEFAPYGTLRRYLICRNVLTDWKIILAGDVAAGVNVLHQCGIIHGDLKLDNVVVIPSLDRPSGVIAKLCDFGHSILISGDEKKMKYYGTSL
jgi:serine/threonine protein kinase